LEKKEIFLCEVAILKRVSSQLIVIFSPTHGKKDFSKKSRVCKS
jgi:hypothetical protein